ncbi:tetratricopeptide repeat protein [Herbaspirillum lusitanum]|uniref:Tetratricopeptide repeat protein n=1 Tax=Herbaspirillum lusitanum TaxID=213312 RepID=A0ABW9AAX3_9BURK
MTSGPQTPRSRQQGTWYSFNAPYERLRLFSPWAIAGFGLAVGLGLALVFPQVSLQQRLATANASGRPDLLTVEYLKVFLKAQPGNDELRLELIKQLVALGQLDDARRQLAQLRLVQDSALRFQAAWMEYRIRQQETFALAEGSAQRTQQMAELRARLHDLLNYALSADQLLGLSQDALALGDSQSARQAFARLLQDKDHLKLSGADALSLGKQSLGMGDYRSSAAFYLMAMESAGSLETRRAHFLTALRTLQAGGLYAEALETADRNLGPLGKDKETLLFLTRLAQSANRPDAAQRYVKQLLQLSMAGQLRTPGLASLAGSFTPAHFERMREFAAALRMPLALRHSPDTLRRQLQASLHEARPVRVASLANGGDAAPADQQGLARLPFDDEIYTLAYTVFLANRNLTDARLLAQSAVRQQPAAAAWRKRLAEVSEWSGLPQEATPQWLAYARQSGDEAGWDAVLRLSGGTFEQDILIESLQHKLQSDPGNQQWLEQLLAQYENIGQPERAIALLEARLKENSRGLTRARRAALMEALARVYLRVGQDDAALDVLRSMRREFGPTPENALLAANQLYLRGRIEEAMAVLQEAAPAAPPENADFWRAYAEVARFLQRDDDARRGYRQMLSSDKAEPNDLSNLIALIQDQEPRAAANLAEFGYRLSGDRNFAIQALSYRQRAGDIEGARRFLDSLKPEQNAELEKSIQFLTARAAQAQLRRDLPAARADMVKALTLRPDSPDARAELIWILIAGREAELLKRALDLWAADAENAPILWGPFAAANMSLNRQPTALHWFRKSGFAQNDYLWLMSYAEALDATSQPDLAWRIRRRAWFELRDPQVLRNMPPSQSREMRDRLASLVPLFMQSDAGLRVMQALLQSDAAKLSQPEQHLPPVDGPGLLREMEDSQMRDAAAGNAQSALTQKLGRGPDALFARNAESGQRPRDDARLSSSVRELALAYAMNQNASDLARAWLATRFARQLDKPLWGELTLALAADDRDGLNRMLDDLPDWLPMYDRVEAARQAGRIPLAQTLAFDQLALLPADEELHARLTNLVTEDPPKFSAGYTSSREFPLETRRFDLKTGAALTPGMTFFFGFSERLQSSSDTSQLDNVPRTDRLFELSLRRRIENGFVSAGLQRRQAAESFNGLHLEFSRQLTPKLTLNGAGGLGQMATESALMRVGGKRSGGELNLNMQISRTEYLRLGGGYQRYYTQAGTALGSGRTLNVEAGTHFRVEYPNLTLRTYVSDAKFVDKGASDDQIARLAPAGSDPAGFRYMPLDSRVFGIALGAGTVAETAYTRAWRPYAEIGLTRTSDIGWGRNLRAGVAGSVIGQDVLSIGLQSTSATPNTPQRGFELGVNYRWLY